MRHEFLEGNLKYILEQNWWLGFSHCHCLGSSLAIKVSISPAGKQLYAVETNSIDKLAIFVVWVFEVLFVHLLAAPRVTIVSWISRNSCWHIVDKMLGSHWVSENTEWPLALTAIVCELWQWVIEIVSEWVSYPVTGQWSSLGQIETFQTSKHCSWRMQKNCTGQAKRKKTRNT